MTVGGNPGKLPSAKRSIRSFLQGSTNGSLAMQVNLNVGGGRPPSQPDLHHTLDVSEITTQVVSEFSVG